MPDSPADRARAVVEAWREPIPECFTRSDEWERLISLIATALRAERAAAFEEAARVADLHYLDADGEWKASTDEEQRRYWSGRRTVMKQIAAALRAQGEAGG